MGLPSAAEGLGSKETSDILEIRRVVFSDLLVSIQKQFGVHINVVFVGSAEDLSRIDRHLSASKSIKVCYAGVFVKTVSENAAEAIGFYQWSSVGSLGFKYTFEKRRGVWQISGKVPD